MHWILTSMAGLTAIYGADGAPTIQAKLAQLASASGAELHLLAANANSSAGSPPLAPALYAELKQLRSGASPDSILIVGDQRVFPGFSLPNPVADRSIDPDLSVLSDNPYGQFDWTQPQDAVLPPCAVGRIAAGVNESAAGLCALLDSQINLRQGHRMKSGYVEIVSRQWQDASNSVLSFTTPSSRVILSPDGRVTAANASSLDCKFLYCNLHGFLNASAWSGYDNGLSFPVPALTPDAFQSDFVGGTVVFTEACYGLAISGKSTGASNALSLIAAGAAAVVGATGLAFGTATAQPQNLIDADVLARGFFNSAASAGTSLGECLANARSALSGTSSRSDPFVVKTLLEFQLLGDPSYVLA